MQQNTQTNVPDILQALKQEFATSINTIYVNSLDKNYSFREITVLEQKTFSKLLIDHEHEPDLVYEAQCSLIKKLCTDPEFDIYSITEFDRLKIFLLIYQSNFFNKSHDITCTECNSKFEYSIDFDAIISSIDKFSVKDTAIDYVFKNRKYEFVVNFPTVKRMIDYKKYQAFQNRKNKKYSDKIRSESNILDMIDLLIKKLTITNLDTGNVIIIDPTQLKYADYMLYLETIPQAILYSDNSPLINEAKRQIDSIKNSLPKAKCPECSTEISVFGDIDGFFI